MALGIHTYFLQGNYDGDFSDPHNVYPTALVIPYNAHAVAMSRRTQLSALSLGLVLLIFPYTKVTRYRQMSVVLLA